MGSRVEGVVIIVIFTRKVRSSWCTPLVVWGYVTSYGILSTAAVFVEKCEGRVANDWRKLTLIVVVVK